MVDVKIFLLNVDTCFVFVYAVSKVQLQLFVENCYKQALTYLLVEAGSSIIILYF